MSKIIYIVGISALSAIILFQYNTQKPTPATLPVVEPPIIVTDPGNFMPLLQTKYDQDMKLGSEFDKVVEFSKTKKGTYGFYIKDLRSKKEYKYNENEDFYAASLFKTPIAIATAKTVDNGKLKWEDVKSLFERLLKNSDNNAQITLTKMLDRTLLIDTYTYFTGNNPKSVFYQQNHSNPVEQGLIYENLYNDTTYISYDSKKYLIQTMSKTAFDDRVAKYLSDDLIFAHKIGNWGDTGSWHDCGILYGDKEYVVCVMSKNTTFADFILVSNELGKIF